MSAPLARILTALCYASGSLRNRVPEGTSTGSNEGGSAGGPTAPSQAARVPSPGGWEFVLKNPPLPMGGDACELRLLVDGRPVPPQRLHLQLGERVYAGGAIGQNAPVRFVPGQGLTVRVDGEPLAPGLHRVELWVRPVDFGQVFTRVAFLDEVHPAAPGSGPAVQGPPETGAGAGERDHPPGGRGWPLGDGKSLVVAPSPQPLSEPPLAAAEGGFDRPVVLANGHAYAVLNRAGDLWARDRWFGSDVEVGGLYLPPTRLTRMVRVGIRLPQNLEPTRGAATGGQEVVWLADRTVRAGLYPGWVASVARLQPGLVVSRWTWMAAELPWVLSRVELSAASACQAELVVECEPALVPYAFAAATAERVEMGFDGDTGALWARGGEPPAGFVVSADRPPDRVELEAGSRRGALFYHVALSPGRPVALLLQVGAEGTGATGAPADTTGAGARGPEAPAVAARDYRQALDQAPRLRGLGDKVDRAWELAVLALETLRAQHPEMGPGICAGLPRFPGYWSRDSAWSALGLLAAGLAHRAKPVLDTFLSLQHPGPGEERGDIPSVIGGPAFLHQTGFGASADGTPLMAIALSEYVVHSGDVEFGRQHLHGLRGLIEWCLRQDRDGDGFSEHGAQASTSDSLTIPDTTWMDHVDRRKSAIEVQALVWQALRCAARLARLLGDIPQAEEWAARAELLERQTWRDFFPPVVPYPADRLDMQGRPDFTLRPNYAVALLFARHLPPERAASALKHLESPELAAPHGIRTLASSDPRYRPTEYHNGAVWNLTTGWAAMALLRWGRLESGLRLIDALAQRLHDEMGMMAELYRGDAPQPYNSCVLQAWSAGVFLLAVARYLLGIRAEAVTGTLELAPNLPPDAAAVTLSGFPVGASRVEITFAGGRARVHNLGPDPVRVRTPAGEAQANPGTNPELPL